MNFKNIAIAVLTLAVILLLIFYSSTDTHYQEQLDEAKQKNKELIQQHEETVINLSRKVDSLTMVADSLVFLRKDMDRRVSELNRELEEVRGRYEDRTPTELEKEMEKRFKERR
jgi:peptidoglycan hydrolase CwlO-like protein